MSDTVSIGSNMSGDPKSPSSPPLGGAAVAAAAAAMTVEEVGQFDLHPEFSSPRRLVLLGYTLAALGGEEGRQTLLLGELRTRGGDDWTLAGRSLAALPHAAERRYLDLALVPNVQDGTSGASVVLLAERRNKERLLVSHHLRHAGKALSMDAEEFTSYDKGNVLGKGVTNIAADPRAPVPTVYSVSNLMRKLRLEDAGTSLRPTTARVQIPAEVQDGTISVAVLSGSGGKQQQQQQQQPRETYVVASFRTKSATKNKFMVEWFVSGRRDELSCARCGVKMGENSEPACVLADPRDAQVAYALCLNRSSGTTAVHKLTRGHRHEEPLATLPFETEIAALGVSASDPQCMTLLTYDASKALARVYALQKTEGFRGRHPVCARCPPLATLSSPGHVVSCATARWQLASSVVDQCVGPRATIQLGLATLLEGGGVHCAKEPESGNAYRVRVASCPTQVLSVAAILLDDLERVFESDQDRLSACTLKVCLSGAPCRDSLSLLSAWLAGGRLAMIEVAYLRGQGEPEVACGGGGGGGSSDRLLVKPISADKFRGFVTDVDWTQFNQRQGTFTLPENHQSSQPQQQPHPASASGPRSRIPRMSSSLSAADHLDAASASASTAVAAPAAGCSQGPLLPHLGSGAALRLLSDLSGSLRTAREEGEAMGRRLEQMERQVEELRAALTTAAAAAAADGSKQENGGGEEEDEEGEEEEVEQ